MASLQLSMGGWPNDLPSHSILAFPRSAVLFGLESSESTRVVFCVDVDAFNVSRSAMGLVTRTKLLGLCWVVRATENNVVESKVHRTDSLLGNSMITREVKDGE